MKHIFIINPISGNHKHDNLNKLIDNYFLKSKEEYQIIKSEYINHAKEISKKLSNKDTIIYSCGGDGTAFEIFNGLHQDAILAVIPIGTGNDFYKMIDNRKLDLETLLLETIEGNISKIDYIQSDDCKSLNSDCIGIDSEVATLANKIKAKIHFPNIISYLLATIVKLLFLKNFEIEVTIDDKIYKHTAILSTFMNGKYYGGGFMPTPNASLKDGLLDICVVDKVSRIKSFSLLAKYLKGNHADIKEINSYVGKKISVKLNKPVGRSADGESKIVTEVNYEIISNRLKFLYPKNSKIN